MASKHAIIAAIERKIAGTSLSTWRIGLTNDLLSQKTHFLEAEQRHVIYWSSWPAASLAEAQAVETHFIDKGVKASAYGRISALRPVYVYLF
ncbi:MAG TPA: hypothetical protein VGN38_07695 [Caulobacteraceae bacterium]|jgi:hypothetical protein|nr:hypothetical protein [Caulobacteraceae bacterium]